MRLDYMLLADAANVSAEGKVNVLGVFGALKAEQFPVTHPSMVLVIQMRASPAERGQRKLMSIRLLDQDGRVLHDVNAETVVPDQPGALTPGLTLLLAMNNLVLPAPGSYTFHLLMNGETKGELTFTADHLQPAPPAE